MKNNEMNLEKTNVMRLLEQKKVSYKDYTYESEGAISGVEVASLLNLVKRCLHCETPWP